MTQVIQQQNPIGVFVRRDGAIFITRYGKGAERDAWIVMQPHNIDPLIRALRSAKKEIEAQASVKEEG